MKPLSTAAAGALDVWVGTVAGLALGLSPALSGVVSVASAVVGVALAVALGGRPRELVYRSERLAERRERIERAWKRYGIPGLALRAPLLSGQTLATLLALAPGAPPPAAVDARRRGLLGRGDHRGRRPGLLGVRALANFSEPPQPEVSRTDLPRTPVNSALEGSRRGALTSAFRLAHSVSP